MHKHKAELLITSNSSMISADPTLKRPHNKCSRNECDLEVAYINVDNKYIKN
jgi:hypothetical protein